ncbi:hypothetical protein [Alteromonas sp. 14N.309.X.WAT.G.H12]|uniref:hypothetical protein n=1 Tax=Alteromonas sp. 14N.309.X.WAT.G.H12 TaxID=3120824 RepID=UPI002FD78288
MIAPVIAALMFPAGYFLTKQYKNRRNFRIKVADIAASITQREEAALSVYEHCFDCAHSKEVQESLEQKGLITWLSVDKFAITPLGYSVAKLRGVLSNKSYVVPVKSTTTKRKVRRTHGVYFYGTESVCEGYRKNDCKKNESTELLPPK